jgi:hypothetical protein
MYLPFMRNIEFLWFHRPLSREASEAASNQGSIGELKRTERLLAS